jgi:branched-chain amino acid aminotransferase
MTLHPPLGLGSGNQPPAWRLASSSVRVMAGDPLAAVKTCSKAAHVAARAEAEARGCDEALLLNHHGHLAETAGANLFWVERDRVCTPPLSAGVLPGITRAVVLELCPHLGLPVVECNGTPETLLQARGVFLTLSTRGIVSVTQLDDRPLSSSPWVGRLQAAYQEVLDRETGRGLGGKGDRSFP